MILLTVAFLYNEMRITLSQCILNDVMGEKKKLNYGDRTQVTLIYCKALSLTFGHDIKSVNNGKIKCLLL